MGAWSQIALDTQYYIQSQKSPEYQQGIMAHDLAAFIETGIGGGQGDAVATLVEQEFGVETSSDLEMLEAAHIDSIISNIGLKFIQAVKLRKTWSQAKVLRMRIIILCVVSSPHLSSHVERLFDYAANYIILVSQALSMVDVQTARDLATFIEMSIGGEQGVEVAAFITSEFGVETSSDLGILEAAQIDSTISHIGLKFVQAAKLQKIWTQAQVLSILISYVLYFLVEMLINSCPAL